MFKIILFCLLCAAIYIVYPYAWYTPEQRNLRRHCKIGEVCILPENEKVVNGRTNFQPHEPKIAYLVYDDPNDLTTAVLEDFNGMFDKDVWKVVRKKRRTESEKQYGMKVYPAIVKYYRNDQMMWKKKLVKKTNDTN